MFKRVMVAVVGLPLLILILGWAPSWATMLLLCLLYTSDAADEL